ncbi:MULTISPECIES: regulatory protein GemA [Paenibacillaceae]|uniref:GemA protein n=2 Tax=Paenibacillaceae TaxID=186822 RepID=A0A511VF10_9BACL|nr:MULTISPECIES: regulatory protein GemA [Paenibacillaceae]MUG72725.1 DUF1018 domain-containing protein [Paenibacillus validus]GEN36133.1 GemA protein [Aneurinibacillus danicus]
MSSNTSTKTPPQLLKKIWALAKEVGMDEDMVRVIAKRVTGQARLSGLSKEQACAVIDAMNEAAGKKKPKPTQREFRMTDAQRRKIEQLVYELGWADDPDHLRKFIKKYYKIDHMDWLTKRLASNLIESLKNVLARHQNKLG